MSSTLEADNEELRQKLQDLRRMNSNLVVENHRLVEALEDLGCKFKSSSVKVHNLEDSIESYRSKSRELSDLLTAVENTSKSNEKDSQIFRLKYEECAHQLSESAKLLMDQADVIQSMKRRLEDVQNLQRKTDEERDMAIETAEKLKCSFEELQAKLRTRTITTDEEADALNRKCDQLVQDLNSSYLQIENLQEDVKHLRVELSAQRNLKKESEQRNSDLRSQMKIQSTKMEKFEEELEMLRKLKIKNGEMKLIMDEQRKRIATLEAELRGAYGRAEALRRQTCQKNSARDRHSLRDTALVLSKVGAIQLNDLQKVRDVERFSSGDSVKQNIPSVDEGDLLRLKTDILTLTCGLGETCFDDFSGILKSNEGDYPEKLQNPTQDRSLAAASILDKRLSNFELLNAKLIAHIAQLDSKIVEQQKNSDIHASEKATLNRDIQKQTQKILLLEKELDGKVQEISRHVFETTTLKNQVEENRKERVKTLKELEEKSENCLQLMSSIERLKQLHVDQCTDLEEQLEMKERLCEKLEEQLEQSEGRCKTMQQSLSQVVQLADALKDDLSGCRQIESMVLLLRQQNRETEQRATTLEHNRDSLESDFINLQKKFQEAKQEHLDELSAKVESIGYLEEKLKEAEEEVAIKEDKMKRMLEENLETTEKLTEDRRLLEEQMVTLREELTKESSVSKSLLQNADENLNRILAELRQKESFIDELVKKTNEVVVENDRLKKLTFELRESERSRREIEVERERLDFVVVQQKEEINLLKAIQKDQENKSDVLQRRLDQAFEELTEKRELTRNSRAEVECMKAEMHTRDSQLLEATRKAENQDSEMRHLKEQLNCSKLMLLQNQNELRQKEAEIESLNERIQERDFTLQEEAKKIQSLESTLGEKLSALSASEKKLTEVTEELRERQDRAEKAGKQAISLEDQLHNSLSVVKEQCLRMREDKETIMRLKREIDAHSGRAVQLENAAEGLREELQRLAAVSKRAESELGRSRERLEKAQQELSSSRQEVTSVRVEHDRLAEDLAEAAVLLRQKDDELMKMLRMLSEAEAIRSRLCDQIHRSEETFDRLKSTYEDDLLKLKKVHEATDAIRDNEKRNLQQDLEEAVRQQRILRDNLKQLRQQVNTIDNAQQVSRDNRNCESIGQTEVNSVQPPTARLYDENKDLTSESGGSSTLSELSPKALRLGAVDVNKHQSHHRLNCFEDWSSSSGVHSSYTEPDRVLEVPVSVGRGLLGTGGGASSESDAASSPPPLSLADSVDCTSDEVLRKMWAHICDSQDEDSHSSTVRQVSSVVGDSTAAATGKRNSHPNSSSVAIGCSAQDRNCAAGGGGGGGKPLPSSSNSSRILSAVGRNSEHLPFKFKSRISSQTTPVKSFISQKSFGSTKERLNRTEVTETVPPPLSVVRKTHPNVGKRSAKQSRLPAADSPFSPTLSSGSLSDPMTAMSYYEKYYPTSISDGEIERIFGGGLN